MFLEKVYQSFNRITSQFSFTDSTKAIVRRDQVNLLVYGPDRTYFKQKQRNIITKFWPTCFFLIYYILLFDEKKKKNNKT